MYVRAYMYNFLDGTDKAENAIDYSDITEVADDTHDPNYGTYLSFYPCKNSTNFSWSVDLRIKSNIVWPFLFTLWD